MSGGRTPDVQKELLWRGIVREQAASGMEVPAWCGQHGVEVRAFYRWRSKLARRDEACGSTSFVPVRVVEDSVKPAGRIEIVLACRRRIRISGPVDREMLADVLAVVEGPSC